MDEESIFATALECKSGAERAAFLDGACGGDQVLRHRVEALLSSHEEAGTFLNEPAAPVATVDQPITEQPGTQIGPYELLQQIGEGGMGVVYLAEQTAPVQRRVALKIIKPGMDTRQVIARFAAEEQALAMMDHPNIAKVWDAGATESGRPYFVMELVKGIPITSYCDQQHRTPRQRLELFMAVCQAVQHAHQKGIIHRDLKPSNILVALYDGRPVPKVIDFGVAKATGAKLTERTMFTQYGQVVGTPEYMSPEQANLNQLDIDTRSDVYSLGVLLYELLTGATPFDKHRLRSAALDEMMRIIREEEPPKPSTRLSTIDTLPSVAANRHIEPKKLSALVRGELDWIVMKALDKERARRYDTASKLAEDIQRYLQDEAVLACPPSAGYRLRKFAKRHKVAFATVSSVTVALLLATVGLSVSTAVVSSALKRETAARQDKTVALEEKTEALRKESEARDAEVHAREDAQRQTVLATKRAEALQRSTYNLQLGRVRELWRAHPNQARQLLEDPERCPEDLRDFTWGLYRRLSANRIAVSSRWSNTTWAAQSVAFSPDGQTVAVYGKRGGEKLLLLYSAETGRELSTLERDSTISQLAYSPDGTILAAAGSDGTIKLWSTQSDQIVQSLPAHAGGVTTLAFARDGVTLASADAQGTIRIWEPTTWKVQTEIKALQERTITKLAFSPDANTLAAADALSVTLWDLASGQQQLVLSGHTLPINDIAFAPDGSTLATASEDKTIRLWHPRTGELLDTLAGHEGSVNAIVFSPDGTTLASGAGRPDMSIKLWNAATHQLRGTLVGHAGPLQRLAYSADGNTLLSAGTPFGNEFITWDVAANKLSDAEMAMEGATIDLGNTDLVRNMVWSVDVAPDASVIASGDGVGRVTLWDTATRDEVMTLGSHAAAVLDVEFSPDGKMLASCPGATDGTIKLWDMQTRLELATLEGHAHGAGGGVWDVTFSPDGTLLASAGADGTVRLWDMNSFREKATLTGHEGSGAYVGGVFAVAFSPDSKTLASAGSDRTVRLWDVQGGRERDILTGHAETVFDIAFSPDGRKLASASWDNTVKLWNVALTKETATLVCQAQVTRVAFSPEGKTLASAGDNGKIRLWDAQTAQERGVLEAHTGAVLALAFSPDGNVLVSGGADGNIKVFIAADPSTADQRLRRYADRAEAYVRQSQAFRNLKQYDQALENVGKALQLDAQNVLIHDERVSIYLDRASHYLQQKEYDQALADYSEAIRLRPESVWSYVNRAVIHTDRGDTDKALADCTEAIRLDPQNALAHCERARAYAAKGDTDKALADYNEAIRLNPQNGLAHYARAVAHRAKGDTDKALADFSEAIRLAPEFAWSYAERGAMHTAKGDTDKALADCTEAIRLMPEFFWGYVARAAMHRAKGDTDKALADYSKAIRLDPSHISSYIARAAMHTAKGDFDEAGADFDKAVELDPQDTRLWYLRSVARLGGGQVEAYRQDCGEMLQRFGQTVEADDCHWVAWTCVLAPDDARDWATASVLADQAVQSDSQSARNLNTLGAVLYRAGRFNEALAHLSKAAARIQEPSEASNMSPAYIWYFLAMAHTKVGHEEQARQYLDKANAWTEKVLDDDENPPPWNRRATLELFRKEAGSLLGTINQQSAGNAHEQKGGDE